MKQWICKFFSVLIMCMTVIGGAMGASSNLTGETGDIGDYGEWITTANIDAFNTNIKNDFQKFQPKHAQQLVKDYVPIEAKAGLAFMNAMTHIGNVLDNSLMRFVIVFLWVMYGGWIGFEAYAMMKAGGKVQETVKNILIKGLVIALWTAVLSFGPSKLFMMIMGPIMMLATYMADLILNAVSFASGMILPDTCGAIREYAVANARADMLLNPTAAADILCLPTRLSGFFKTGIAVGWKWMGIGLGNSMFTFLMGAGFVGGFVYAMWKFALMGLGVIADLFLAIFMLPFCAINDCAVKTNYKGVAGEIFNAFAGMLKFSPTKEVVNKFISAGIYYILMGILIALCASILSGVIQPALESQVPTLADLGFLPVLITLCLVLHLATQTDKIARDWGGKIDDSWGTKLEGDIKTLTKDAYKTGKGWWEAIKKARSS